MKKKMSNTSINYKCPIFKTRSEKVYDFVSPVQSGPVSSLTVQRSWGKKAKTNFPQLRKFNGRMKGQWK